MAQIPTQNSAGSTASVYSKLSGCNCAFGAGINASVNPSNTYGIATIGYVDASIKKHDESENPHDFILSGFITEVNGFKAKGHSLGLSSLVEYNPYGEELSRINADGTGTFNGSSVRYVNTISMSADLHDIIENHIKPLELSSVKWEAASNEVTAHSLEWNWTYGTVSESSDSWSSVYSTVSSTSALWNGGGEVKEKAEIAYSTVSSTSAYWNSKQDGLHTESGSTVISTVDELPSTEKLNSLVTSRGVATALGGKMDRTFPVYVYQGTSKYKVSIGAVGTGFGFIVTSAESWPISTKYQNVHNTNLAQFAYDGEPYSGKIVANDNCSLSGVWCTMGGEPQTVAEDGTISIPSVTATIAISGLGISTVRGSYSEDSGILTLPSDARLDTANPSVLHMGSFATSMDNANILLQCDFVKKPFRVTYDLHNVTSTETATSVAQSASYSTVISPRSGYTMAASSCTMGDVPQPIAEGHIDIAHVIGDVVISALATLGSQSGYDKHTGLLTFASNVTYDVTDGTLKLDSCDWNQTTGTLTMSGNRTLDTYTVTNSLVRCTSDNPSTTVTETSAYVANITPNDGYVLTSVSYTMGGTPHSVTGSSISITSVDGNLAITAVATLASSAEYSQSTKTLTLPSDTGFSDGTLSFVDSAYWNGTNGQFTIVGRRSLSTFSVTNNIPFCTSSNPATSVEESHPYTATITPSDAYVITSMDCTMRGISQSVSNNSVSIPSVDGDIVINTTADHTLKFTSITPSAAVAMGVNLFTPYISLEYSKDGVSWSDYEISVEEYSGPTITLSSIGDCVYFRAGDGGNPKFSYGYDYYMFVTQPGGLVAVDGDIQGLLDNTLKRTDVPHYAYQWLFYGCEHMVSAPTLCGTEVGFYSYAHMFDSCRNLVTPPELNALSLSGWCYESMFCDCHSMTSLPRLEATTLYNMCYTCMFWNCSSVTSDSFTLPATSLGDMCYEDMFHGVTSVTKVYMPNLSEGDYDPSVHGVLARDHEIEIVYGK